MSTSRSAELQLWGRPPHAAAKHSLLRAYLGAWFPIIAKYNRRVIYYDAFAGPGEYSNGNPRYPGSPIIALDTLLGHDYLPNMSGTEFLFLFNEKDPACGANLARLVAEMKANTPPGRRMSRWASRTRPFIEVTGEMLDDLDGRNARLAPTFSFVDPAASKPPRCRSSLA
ncbi:three-Cys-motif partner protein TcmP [Amycolatopsis sp., V23-08]|uniref:Three-Cys-motif partner protein TcmP n=1 Tax=Amycolatopsis heterodermiae TaxID=3110235 RepID=A0ABU5RIW7_9PSEU|nr:three-Cys-motif partner protein TcmP [Amycolatopsis sp., V23-08]MEA5366222.1 three-Cys-motif partner protein TcmP [Amycolatopsis sp., V23-08]